MSIHFSASQFRAVSPQPRFAGRKIDTMGNAKVGQETVESVEAMGNVKLNGTTVTGMVSAMGKLDAVDCPSLGRLSVSGNGIISGSTVHGDADVSGSLDVQNSTLEAVDVAGSLKAINSTLQNASVAGKTTLSLSTVLGNLDTSGKLKMSSSKVHGNVDVAGKPEISNSTIDGKLTATAEEATIQGSRIAAIKLRMPSNFSSGTIVGFDGATWVGNNNIMIGSDMRIFKGKNASISFIDKQIVIQAEPYGDAKGNGFEITASSSYTILQTPEGYLYWNGDLAGEAPSEELKTFAGYKKRLEAQGKTITVTGPGWNDHGEKAPAPTEEESAPVASQPVEAPKPKQTLILEDTIVEGDVEFTGGNGEVILVGNSQVKGQVIGGKISQH